jgi:hypothetical protein
MRVRAATVPLTLAPPVAPGRNLVDILAIDPGIQSMGWARVIRGQITSGTRRLRQEGEFEAGHFWWGRALLTYRRWLTKALQEPTDELWIEHPSIPSPERFQMHATGRICTLYCFAEAILDELNSAGRGICWRGDTRRQAVFKLCCGDGNAKKPAILEAAKIWGYAPKSQDEAMAIGLLHYARAQPNL